MTIAVMLHPAAGHCRTAAISRGRIVVGSLPDTGTTPSPRARADTVTLPDPRLRGAMSRAAP